MADTATPISLAPDITMRVFLESAKFLGAQFNDASWLAAKVLLIAAAGELLTDPERTLFRELTGRDREPMVRSLELWIIAARRSGKSRMIAALVVYVAIAFDHSKWLAPGERGVIAILSAYRQDFSSFGASGASFEADSG